MGYKIKDAMPKKHEPKIKDAMPKKYEPPKDAIPSGMSQKKREHNECLDTRLKKKERKKMGARAPDKKVRIAHTL